MAKEIIKGSDKERMKAAKAKRLKLVPVTTKEENENLVKKLKESKAEAKAEAAKAEEKKEAPKRGRAKKES